MNQSIKTIFLVFITMFAFSLNALAVPKTLSFQSKIYKPDGLPLEAPAVNFRFTTVDPTGTCILYVEDFVNVDMSGSTGLVVFNLGAGTKVYPTAAYTFTNLFNNLSTSMNCQGGGTFSPDVSGNDNRKIITQFTDGSANGWQSLPAININSVPFSNFAGDSAKLAGFTASDFLRFSTLPVCNPGDVLTVTNPGSGPSLRCVPGPVAATDATASAKGVVQVGSGLAVAAGVISLDNFDAAKITTGVITASRLGTGTPSATNYLRGDGSWASVTGGTVTAVSSASSYLTVTNPSTTPSLAVNVGTAANTLAAGDDSRIVNAIQAASYAADVADAISCLDSQKPYWSTVNDRWMCTAINDSTKLPIAGGTLSGTVIAASGTAAAPSVGVGQATAGLFSAGANSVSVSTNGFERMRFDNTGNVGIGTSTPSSLFEVNGNRTGSGGISGTTTTITGSGTLFTSEIVVGDVINYSGVERTVTSIANNTSLTVNLPFIVNPAGGPFLIEKKVSLGNGNATIGANSGTATMISSAATLFPSVVPKLEITTGGLTYNSYSDLVVIRHANQPLNTGSTRQVGLMMKLSTEADNNESGKSGGMMVESTNVYANAPNLYLVTQNNKRMTVTYNGNVGIANMNPTYPLDVTGAIRSSLALMNSSAVPTISACGTAPPAAAVGSNNNSGQFTLGGGNTSACTVTFANAFPTNAFCTVTPASNYIGTYYISAQSSAAFTVTLGTGAASTKFNYSCGGN